MAALLLSACAAGPDEVHDDATLVDLHMDTIGPVMVGRDLSVDNPFGHVDIPKLRRGGYDLVFWSVWTPPGEHGAPGYFAEAIGMIDALDALIARHPEDFALVRSAQETYRANESGRIACAIGVEGAHMLDGDLSNLQVLYERGVRYITLTWNNSNEFATSATDETAGTAGPDPGLTDLGRSLVGEMNRLGILVDISHVGERTFWETLEISEDPLIASHSVAWSVRSHSRNLKDDQIRALAARGGVVGLTFVASFVDSTYSERRAQAERRIGEAAGLLTDELFDWDRDRYYALQDSLFGASLGTLRPTLDLFLAHLEHVVNLAGVDAVALGSDFDGTSLTPHGLEDAGQVRSLTRALLARGYTGQDVQKILGGNFMRVFEQVTGR